MTLDREKETFSDSRPALGNILFDKVPRRLGESPLLSRIARNYSAVPSAVIIRTAEAELLRALPTDPPALDLCCGDGFVSSLSHPEGYEVGCDVLKSVLRQAARRNIYRFLVCMDIRRGIPFRSEYFRTVVSNSALEHIDDIENVLREIARVLKPGGKLYTTFPSDHAYAWWPCGIVALKHYFKLQPIVNSFSLEQWKQRMAAVGLRVVDHRYYLSKRATQVLLFLDYHSSRAYLTSDKGSVRFLIRLMRLWPRMWTKLWEIIFGRVKISAEGEGGGILVIAERRL